MAKKNNSAAVSRLKEDDLIVVTGAGDLSPGHQRDISVKGIYLHEQLI